MDKRLEIIDPLQFEGWDEWVLASPSHSVFHSRAWARVLVDSYGYTPHYLMLVQNGLPCAAWPMFETRSLWKGKKGISLPFSDHCEPILSDDACFQDLFDGVIRYARQLKWKSVEFRGGQRYFNRHPKAASYNFHLLELSSHEQEMANRLRSSTRRNIKKATKAQIDISINTSFESVREFYSLNCLTRKHHGLPPQPFSFFKNIYRHIIRKKMGIVVLARHEDHLIAGAVYLHFGDNATYKYGASHRKYLELRPNNLVMWEAIKWYGRQGYKQFDLGRSEPDNPGLNQFKNGWGATASPIAYYRYDTVQQTFVESEDSFPPFINRAFRMMPVPVLRLFGALAYRHMA